MTNDDLEARLAVAQRAIDENSVERLRRALADIPTDALKGVWHPDPLLARAAERGNPALVELLLSHGANPNIERAEHEEARMGHTALYLAKDPATVAALLDAGADPDLLVVRPGYDGIGLLRDSVPRPHAELIDARHPTPPASGVTGTWELAAAQRAPGGLSEEELEESYEDEYRVGFPFDWESVKLHVHADGRLTGTVNGSEFEVRWEATPSGFIFRDSDDGRELEYIAEVGSVRPAWWQGDVLVLWIGDRRYHLRRPGTFRREATRLSVK